MLRGIQQHRRHHMVLRQAATIRGAGQTHPLQNPPHSCSLWTQSTISLGLRRLNPEAHADLQRLLQHGQLENAMAFLSSLRGQGLYPAPGLVDHFTRLCVHSRRREVAWGMLRQEGIPAHVATYKTLLESYARSLPPSQDKITGSPQSQQQRQQQQQLPQAFRLLEEMKTLHHVRPDAACYLVVLQGCAEAGEWQEAMRLRKELLSSLATPSEMEVTEEAATMARKKSLALLLQALARDGQLAKALNLLQDHSEIGNADMNAVAALLEGGMAREGGMEEALGVITSLRNTPWWLRQKQDLQQQHQEQDRQQQIRGKAEGRVEEAFLLALLQACKRLGLWQEAQRILRTSPLSSSTPTTTPPTVYYSLAIGACGRASPPQPQAALDLFHSMRHPPDAITYLELLRTCSAGQRGNDAVALLLRPSISPPPPTSFLHDLRSYHGAMRVCLQTKEYPTVLRLWASLRVKGGGEGGLAPSDVTCNYLVRACLNSGRWKEALRALEQRGVLRAVAGEGGRGGVREEGRGGTSDFTDASLSEGRAESGAVGLDIEGVEDTYDAVLSNQHCNITTTTGGSSTSTSTSHHRRHPNGPILLRELYSVALTAYERDRDWSRFLHTLQALARHLGSGLREVDEDEDGGEEEDSRLTRTCNRAVTCAVRERKWEAAVSLHKGMQQTGLRVRPDLMAYNATMKGTSPTLYHSPPLPPSSCTLGTPTLLPYNSPIRAGQTRGGPVSPRRNGGKKRPGPGRNVVLDHDSRVWEGRGMEAGLGAAACHGSETFYQCCAREGERKGEGRGGRRGGRRGLGRGRE